MGNIIKCCKATKPCENCLKIFHSSKLLIIYELDEKSKQIFPELINKKIYIPVEFNEYGSNISYYNTMELKYICSECYEKHHEKNYNEWKMKKKQLMLTKSILLNQSQAGSKFKNPKRFVPKSISNPDPLYAIKND
ncbi:MAG: hypothetical protein Edafosvirus20_19 [Edafosvirus sp.]|uniref:Uncharacterized protein n=1 Tax=Edafosvirus sp. TaxID=2487765 RepID=A0A3G4ZYY9_9VIRU|nr:MAG: hypothetical protein Edafosvirus20_19 [Edafosvirus sp.]